MAGLKSRGLSPEKECVEARGTNPMLRHPIRFHLELLMMAKPQLRHGKQKQAERNRGSLVEAVWKLQTGEPIKRVVVDQQFLRLHEGAPDENRF